MACVENVPPENEESEMEEGEIVDDFDELSDISSEEEFLLRQRLQVLENYNNVLERKKAKDSSFGPGRRKEDTFQHELSEISATELEDSFANVTSKENIIIVRDSKEQKQKPHHKPKKKKDVHIHSLGKTKELKKKSHRKKKLELKIISESSESEDEYRNKRRKLADAVALNRDKNDKSSLHDRLQKMLGKKTPNFIKHIDTQDKETETDLPKLEDVSCSPVFKSDSTKTATESKEDLQIIEENKQEISSELIDLCTDDDVAVIKIDETSRDTVDSVHVEKTESQNKKEIGDSDEDLELLRQHALKSKASKTKVEKILQEPQQQNPVKQQKTTESENHLYMSDDEDSDTAELRLICLKSALLKKAIEMKQKQKLQKRLSQSSNIQDDFFDEYKELENRLKSENNTDIESVDMDIGSDVDEKTKDFPKENNKIVENIQHEHNQQNNKSNAETQVAKEDELEEDEDLLRAKLLTSLSKNLPNLVDPTIVKNIDEEKPRESTPPVSKVKIPENRIVINLGESDSEGEHEATKNLTKMHAKLSEQMEFQQKLDMFLKSTRMEVERKKLPDLVQNPVPKTTEKYVPKTVNHLPRSEQIEYKNLVKRMAELQKIKEARQSAMNTANQPLAKDTLKPRNVTKDISNNALIHKIEEQIAMSRKNIAEESSRMMKLKEEAVKLSQKYKIVANELKNISTAITLNKKQQRTVENKLSKIRLQHQRLLNSSIKHSNANGNLLINNKIIPTTKLQKENNPGKEEYKNPQILKSVKVSVVNDLEEPILPSSRLSVQIDVGPGSNTKIVKSVAERIVDIQPHSNVENTKESDFSIPLVDKGGGDALETALTRIDKKQDPDDYKSPLDALESANWEADPNAIMCPFEVGGNCKDSDCKFYHPKTSSQ